MTVQKVCKHFTLQVFIPTRKLQAILTLFMGVWNLDNHLAYQFILFSKFQTHPGFTLCVFIAK